MIKVGWGKKSEEWSMTEDALVDKAHAGAGWGGGSGTINGPDLSAPPDQYKAHPLTPPPHPLYYDSTKEEERGGVGGGSSPRGALFPDSHATLSPTGRGITFYQYLTIGAETMSPVRF